MIDLFNINQYKIDTSQFTNLLHDEVVTEFEQEFAEYVGAKYACSANSASSLIYLALAGRRDVIKLPSIIPPVVPNMVIAAGNHIDFYDNVDWVGGKYQIADGIWDSAQEVTKNQYADTVANRANYATEARDIMIFSFYPTKPVGSCDGGMVVSNDKEKIDWFRAITMNGTVFNKDSWQREQIMSGYKFHSNSLQMYMAQQNLRKLDAKNRALHEIRWIYNAEFDLHNTSGHLYRIRVKNNVEFIKKMKEVGINCGIHYKCCHEKQFFGGYWGLRLPQSELEERQTVSIPFHENLSPLDVRKVIDNVSAFMGHV